MNGTGCTWWQNMTFDKIALETPISSGMCASKSAHLHAKSSCTPGRMTGALTVSMRDNPASGSIRLKASQVRSELAEGSCRKA